MAHTSSSLANPAPLGLMGFGMTTVLLNLHNAGLVPMGSAILGMGLVFGGAAQVIAGILEYQKGNTFGMTAFTAYGAFWISLVSLIALPHFGVGEPSTPALMGSYLLIWGLFTLVMFFGTLRATKVHQIIFSSLTLLFLLLGLGDLLGEPTLTHLAGYEGLFCGFSAIYLAAAEILEEQFQYAVLPVGPYTPALQPALA
ncbi:MAG: acetate uptake transporter [Acetobacter orientalis]|uniref:acetate uptake transporter n=1 Tax=Acetobacter orientalis TaxID=146474 RepID=UPI0039EC87EE